MGAEAPEFRLAGVAGDDLDERSPTEKAAGSVSIANTPTEADSSAKSAWDSESVDRKSFVGIQLCGSDLGW